MVWEKAVSITDCPEMVLIRNVYAVIAIKKSV